MKQRLEDIGVKMEVLYDKLRAGQVRVHVAWLKHKVFLFSYSDDSHYFLMQMCMWYHLSNILRSGKEKNGLTIDIPFNLKSLLLSLLT